MHANTSATDVPFAPGRIRVRCLVLWHISSGEPRSPRWPIHKAGSKLHSSRTSVPCCLSSMHARPARSAFSCSREAPQPDLTGRAVNSGAILGAKPQASTPLTDFQTHAFVSHNSPGQTMQSASSPPARLCGGWRSALFSIRYFFLVTAAPSCVTSITICAQIKGTHFLASQTATRLFSRLASRKADFTIGTSQLAA